MTRRGGGFVEFSMPEPEGQRLGAVHEVMAGTGGGYMEASAATDVCIARCCSCCMLGGVFLVWSIVPLLGVWVYKVSPITIGMPICLRNVQNG